MAAVIVLCTSILKYKAPLFLDDYYTRIGLYAGLPKNRLYNNYLKYYLKI